MPDFHAGLRRFATERPWFRYYYVTAHDIAALVEAAAGKLSGPSGLLVGAAQLANANCVGRP